MNEVNFEREELILFIGRVDSGILDSMAMRNWCWRSSAINIPTPKGSHLFPWVIVACGMIDMTSSARFVVGFSAGSNITQKLLLESKKASELVHGAFCVCVNQDYFAARERLEKTVHGRVYSYLMSSLQKVHYLSEAEVIQASDMSSLARISC